jgi:hypothetical protein
MARLYEQGADETRLGLYARRWWRWANAGVTLSHLRGLLLGRAMIKFIIKPEAKVLSYKSGDWLHLTSEAAQLVHCCEVNEGGMIVIKVQPHRYAVTLEDVKIVF